MPLPNQENTMLQAALAAAQAGMSVIPIRPAAGGESKKPAEAWKPYQTQAATEQQIRNWYEHNNYGIAIICGQVSGNLTMIELEGRAISQSGKLADAIKQAGLTNQWRAITRGWSEKSPSGGAHTYLRTPTPYTVAGKPAGNLKLARTRGQDGHPLVLAETRGEGGYSITAPTPGTFHPTGQPWTTIHGGPATVATISCEDLEKILHTIRETLNDYQPTITPQNTITQPATTAGASAGDGERPGDIYNRQATWQQILEPAGWRIWSKNGKETYWTRPGKNSDISASTGYGDGDYLWIWSTSTDLESEHAYDKFGAYTALNHAGDWKAAAQQLIKDGYFKKENYQLLTPDTIITPANTPQATSKNNAETVNLDVDPNTGEILTTTTSDADSDGADSDDNTPPVLRDQTEDANALLLTDQYGNRIRYITDQQRWLDWDGHTWQEQPQSGGTIREHAKNLARQYPTNSKTEQNWRKNSLSARGVTATLQQASTITTITVTSNQLDAHPNQANTPDGIINTQTGALTPSDPTMLHTKTTPITPKRQPTPLWDQFLADTFKGHPGVAEYVQRLFGYTLGGNPTQQILPFCYGPGANGKSVLAEIMQHVFGDYAQTCPPSFLTITYGAGSNTADVARLKGVRLAICSEISPGAQFDEAKIKQLTGGDTITARHLYAEYSSFQPTHTLWLLGNHQPAVKAGGDAFWRRIRLIPFTNTVPPEKRNPNLVRQLISQEAAGILQWVVDGAIEYAKNGLQEPEEVTTATEQYALDADQLKRFVSEKLALTNDPNEQVTYKDMRQVYENWCNAEGIKAVSQRTFTVEITNRYPIKAVKTDGVRRYRYVKFIDGPIQQIITGDAWSDLGGNHA